MYYLCIIIIKQQANMVVFENFCLEMHKKNDNFYNNDSIVKVLLKLHNIIRSLCISIPDSLDCQYY